MKKLGFYAYDVGPSRVLEGIQDIAKEMGHETVMLPPQVQNVARDRIEELRACSLVLLGLSTHETDQEIALADTLMKDGIPVVVIEDTLGTSLRPAARSIAPTVTADIVALPAGIETAHSFGYKKELYLGPPSHWGEDYKKILDAESLRPTLRKVRPGNGESVPIGEDDILINIEGGKGRPLQINKVLRSIRDAAFALFGDRVVLSFGKHPGERAEKNEEQELYARAYEDRERALSEKGLWTIDSKLSNAQRVGVADLTVFSGGGPTQSITGAYARKTTAYWMQDAPGIMKDQIGGTSSWFVADLGGTYPLMSADPERLQKDLQILFSAEGQAALHAKQVEQFPLPEQWDCRRKILAFLETL